MGPGGPLGPAGPSFPDGPWKQENVAQEPEPDESRLTEPAGRYSPSLQLVPWVRRDHERLEYPANTRKHAELLLS